jgi:hypothetical protein
MVVQYLRTKYPGFVKRGDGEWVLAGLGYREKDCPLVKLDDPELTKQLPGFSFYQTNLLNSNWEWQEVQVIVSLSKAADEYMLHDLLSPSFTEESCDFMAQFSHMRRETQEGQERLARAIAGLFKRITYKGDLRNGHVDSYAYVIELWHSGRHWLTLWFHYSPAGLLERIQVVVPGK